MSDQETTATNTGTEQGSAADATTTQAAAAVDQSGKDTAAAGKGVDTLATSGGEDQDKPTATQADWPDDWREKLAGGDEKLLGRLKRFSAPSNVLKSWLAAEGKISSGEFRKALTEGASPEEVATWRKENGIPETPDKYDTDLGNGIVWGETDKPLLESFTAYAHGKNWTPAQVKEGLGWYQQMQVEAQNKQQEADSAFRQQADDELRQEWGADYRRNLTAMQNMMATWPAGLPDILLGARLGDGTVAGNNPAFLRQMAQLARELNPAATLVPAGTSDASKGVNDRIGEIEAMMRDKDKKSEYWGSEKIQQEYRDLLNAREQMQARGKAA